ncbi:Globin-like domain and Globin, structural domain-containing protein [Aphelenchoides fujianensis]|nr:Globin-like domain and Globin, structural domain-containing protein [Aphelenchoides fujianensis]
MPRCFRSFGGGFDRNKSRRRKEIKIEQHFFSTGHTSTRPEDGIHFVLDRATWATPSRLIKETSPALKPDSASTEKLNNCGEGSLKKTSSTSTDLKKKKNCEASKSTSSLEGKSRTPILTSSQRQIVKFCMENAKGDLGERIFRRLGDKARGLQVLRGLLAKPDGTELIEGLRLFIHKAVEVVADPEAVDAVSREFGERHAHLRSIGFKPDFFMGLADAITTECVFLDLAAHASTETLMAWSQLTSTIFSAVRDGYYAELRRLRRVSNSSANKEGEDQSPAAETQKELTPNDDDRISAVSAESAAHEDTGVPLDPAGQIRAHPISCASFRFLNTRLSLRGVLPSLINLFLSEQGGHSL